MKGKKWLAALVATSAVVLALAVAPAAFAWNPTLTASLDCNGVVSYTVTADELDASRDNPDIAVFDDAALTDQVGSGAFDAADNWSFSGTFTVSTSVTTLTVTAEALGPWGDGHYEAAPTSVTVSRPAVCPLPSSTSTVIHDAAEQTVTAVTAGTTVHDIVSVTGSAGGSVPTGVTTIDWFTNGTCSGSPAAISGAVSLVGGEADATAFPQTPTAPGSYAFEADYAGDASYLPSAGPCEPLTVTQASPSITTSASGPVTVGGTITDTATLSGGVALTGAVTFKVYGPGDTSCSTPLATLGATPGTVDANGNGTYTSTSFVTTGVGVYRWRAFFAGDSGNAPASTVCNDANESSTSNQATPSIVTTASGPVTLGGTIQDTATLAGAVAATGAVTFKLYGPGDSGCSSAIATLGSTTISADANGNGSYTSAAYTPSAAGVYRWRAFFAGDADNAAASTPCNEAAETSTVNAPPPTPPTPPTPATPSPPAATVPPVAVSSPSIAITKNPKAQTTLSGGTATWTITVTNTGNVTLSNVRVTDVQAPGCARTSAEIAGLASMAPGSTLSYQCTLADVTASFMNIAVATGTPPTGPDVTSSDYANVTVNPRPTAAPAPPHPTSPLKPPVFHPRISIVKDPTSQRIARGGTATFRITVSNPGDVVLHHVTVSDPRSANCDRKLGTLQAGASRSYTCSRHLVQASFENVAAATGKPPTGPTVTAHAHAPVHVVPPKPRPKPAGKKPPRKPKVIVQHHKPKTTG